MIQFRCECGKTFVLKDTAAGQKVKCSKCQRVLIVPGSPATSQPAPVGTGIPSRGAAAPLKPPALPPKPRPPHEGMKTIGRSLRVTGMLLAAAGGVAFLLAMVVLITATLDRQGVFVLLAMTAGMGAAGGVTYAVAKSQQRLHQRVWTKGDLVKGRIKVQGQTGYGAAGLAVGLFAKHVWVDYTYRGKKLNSYGGFVPAHELPPQRDGWTWVLVDPESPHRCILIPYSAWSLGKPTVPWESS